MDIFVQRRTRNLFRFRFADLKRGHVEPEDVNRFLLTNAMTPSNRLLLNCRVPIRADEIDLTIIGLQVKPFTTGLDLQDKELVTSLQRFTASPCSAIK